MFRFGLMAVTGTIELRCGRGNDLLDAGPGDDALDGGDGDDVLIGGDGNDKLRGRQGADLLIGGLGMDDLKSEGNGDILIGGYTSHDSNAASLEAIVAIWNSGASYADRVANIRDGYLRAGDTVFDDAAKDELNGGSGRDWFFADLDQLDGDDDDFKGAKSNEQFDLLN